MSADNVLRGEYRETVKRLDEKIESLGGDMRDLKAQVESSNRQTQTDIQELTRTINRWGGAIAVITAVALIVLAWLISQVAF